MSASCELESCLSLSTFLFKILFLPAVPSSLLFLRSCPRGGLWLPRVTSCSLLPRIYLHPTEIETECLSPTFPPPHICTWCVSLIIERIGSAGTWWNIYQYKNIRGYWERPSASSEWPVHFRMGRMEQSSHAKVDCQVKYQASGRAVEGQRLGLADILSIHTACWGPAWGERVKSVRITVPFGGGARNWSPNSK